MALSLSHAALSHGRVCDSVKKGVVSATGEVFAVKFIHKRYALERGSIDAKQLHAEPALHRHCGAHANLIQYFGHGEDDIWMWVAMEFAEGGDLFDKIGSPPSTRPDVLPCHRLI